MRPDKEETDGKLRCDLKELPVCPKMKRDRKDKQRDPKGESYQPKRCILLNQVQLWEEKRMKVHLRVADRIDCNDGWDEGFERVLRKSE